MLGPQELQAPYDINDLNGPGPKPKVGSVKPIKASTFDIKDLDNHAQSPVSIGEARPTDVEDYGKILDQGVYSDQDIDSERGQHQSILAKAGHMIGNLPGNIIGSFMEGIGDLGLLFGQYGDDRTYHNALIDAGEKLHNLTGDIYMRNDHSTLGKTVSDPSWWLDQVGGLAEFAVSYAALGAGVAGSIGKMTEGVANLVKAGEVGSRIAQGASQLGTAGFMAYTMGANSGARVFQSTYEHQFQHFLDSGDDPDTAKEKATHIAAQSAATTAQLTTAIGTGLALTGLGAYFSKADDTAMNILKKEVPQQVGESTAEWASRVKSLDPENYATALNPSISISHKLAEMGKMGIEMQQLQFGEKTGEDLGKKGKIRGFIDQFGELQHYLDRTMDKDGATAFFIGAVSGLAIDKVRNDIIPSRWADKIDPVTGQGIPRVNASGEEIGMEKKLYTPKAYSELHTKLKFNSMRDAIASDITNFDKAQQEYLAAVKAGDPVAQDRAASNMYNVNNVNAITSGLHDVWKNTYDGIAEMSPEDAIQRGFTKDVNDTEYQDKAKKASANLDKYQKMYDDLQTRYGTSYEANQKYKPVVDGLFDRKVHLDQWDDILKDHEERLKKSNEQEDRILPIANPELFDYNTAEYSRTWEAAKSTVDKLKKDHKLLSDLVDQYNSPALTEAGRESVAKRMSVIAREYQAIDTDANNSVDSIHKSLKATTERINDSIHEQGEKVKQAEDNMVNSSTYSKWLENNPGKSFADYYKKVQDGVANKEYAAQIALSREKYSIAKKNVAEVEKSKNLNRFANKYDKYLQDEYKKSDEFEKQQNKEIADRAKDQTAIDKMRRERINKMADKYSSIRDSYVNSVNESRHRLDAINKELEGQKLKDLPKSVALRLEKHKLQRKIATETEKIKRYNQLFEDNHISDSTHTEPVSVDSVTTKPIENEESKSNASTDQVDEGLLLDTQDVNPEAKEDIQQLADQQAEEVGKEIDKVLRTVEEAQGNLIDHMAMHQNFGDVLEKIQIVHDQLMSGNGFSYDALKKEVMEGALTQEEAAKTLQALKDYVEAVQRAQDKGDVMQFQSSQLIVVEEQVVDGVPIDLPTDPIIDNTPDRPESYEVPQDQIGTTYEGDKTVNANTIANSTLGFNRTKEGIVNNKDDVNQNTSKLVLSSKGLTPGSLLRYEIDTEYDGPKKLVNATWDDNDIGHETIEDYLDEKGKVPADKMGNVPIRVIDAKSGEKVGYVRKHEWVTERVKGSLKNIAEKYDDDGNEVNGAEQSKRILDIRKEIVDRFNASGEPTHGQVDTKGVGHVIFNTNDRGKVEPSFAFNRKDGGMLPDPKLEIVVADNGTLKSGKNFVTTKPIAGKTDNLVNGSIHVLLPGANGQHIPVPLVGKSLGDSEVPHRTISRALELYLSYTGDDNHPITKEIRTLENNTGFDVSKEDGLRSFINQYFTHLQRFNDTALESGQGGQSKFLFNVWDKIDGKEGKAWIKLGFTGSGQEPLYAKLGDDGKLDQQFSDQLKKGLATRSKAVVYSRDNLRGINEKRSQDNLFKDAIYTSNGKWQHPEYSDYNEYVKSFSKTTAYGKNKLNDGSYVYVANPSIAYTMDSDYTRSTPTLVETNTSRSVEVSKELEHFDKSLADEFDSLYNAMPQRKITAIGSGDEKHSQELTLSNLEKLRNLLPEEQRNGRTPADILRELQDRGHSFLSDGYNPFSLCL